MVFAAINYYSKAIGMWPVNRKFFSSRAICYFLLDEFSKAKDDYKQAIFLGNDCEKT